MIFLPFIFLQFIYILPTTARFLVSNELSTNVASTGWLEKLSGNSMSICQKDLATFCIGKQQSLTNIYWEKIYSLPSSTRLDIYIEFQVSGTWNSQNLEIYANNILQKSLTITLTDQNRLCNTRQQLLLIRSLYESFVYLSFLANIDTLKLTIKSNGINQGLYIQNIVINQKTQYGRNNIIPFINYIKTCTIGSGLQFIQYYCQCTSSQVFENNQCKSACSQGYLYDPTTNECYQKQNCNQCAGANTVLKCDTGTFKYLESTTSSSNCVQRCPGDYYADPQSASCIDMRSYLQQNDNNGYPVNHQFFYKNTADFFHFFAINDFRIVVTSVPAKIQERSFVYRQGQFVAGSYETFQSQTILIQSYVKYSQYKLRFTAVGHFIDFLPTRNDVYINRVLQPQSTVLQYAVNQQKIDQDYITYYDYNWTRTETYPVSFNNFQFEIEQPLQNGAYQGYFYLEDIHVYTYECKTNCDSCFTIAYCSPCLNPAHKNPSDCSCLAGYTLLGDLCIACPTYCTGCAVQGICNDCLVSTKRINSPNCDTCPEQYYIQTDQDNCQSCQVGCRICTTNTSCNNCLSGYFKNSDSKCVIQCIDGYWNDNTNTNNPVCTICNINCLKCQNSAAYCTACSGTATLVNNHCYTCLDGQYLSGTSCLSCIPNCQQCQGSTCLLCFESYYLQSNTGQCVSLCDQKQFGNLTTRTCDPCDQTCLNCLSGTANDCVSCPPGRILNLQGVISGQCQLNCLVGYFRQGDFCGKCWKGCASCTDATPACLVCAQKYYRYKTNGLCYAQCPDGFYNNKMGYVCSSCNPICKTCNGSTDSNCQSCTLPLALYQNQCITDCPQGYGNVNAICQSCTPNCDSCFGTAPNECAVCSKGFYFLKNQCYFKCPTSFVGVRPQYLCKCIYDNCVACTAVQFFYNNHCYDVCPNGSFGFNGLCVKCDISCNSCFGEEENSCLSCSPPLILFQNRCVSECTSRTFHELTKNECDYCNDSCLACNGPNQDNCTACFDIQLLTQDGYCVDQCSENEYPVLSEKKCFMCDPSCLTCFSGAKNNCLTCSNLFYLYQCVDSCPDGFKVSANLISCEPNFAIVITQCAYQCGTCELVPRFCKSCSGNRIPNPPNCDCDSGYFDDGSHENCQQCVNKCQSCSIYADACVTCKGDRLLPSCSCPYYYYDDGVSVRCTRCPDNCSTCNASGCITCLTNRINPPDCICPDGYYESFAPFCLECAKKCLTCSITDQLCGTCTDIRENPPICNCPDGYFENSNEDCQKCSPTCIDCNLTGCLSCFGNRIGPVAGQCVCNTPGVSRVSVGSVYCTDCKMGVPYFALNSDFTGFYFDFGGQVTVIVDNSNNDLCSQIFAVETLAKLGTNPQCDIFLNVLFGENTTIQVGDMIQLNPQFMMLGCTKKFELIQSMPLSIPQTIIPSTRKPIVQFKELISPNVCTPISIEFDKKIYNGMQKLKILSWNMILPTLSDPQIDAILLANVANNSEVIVFPIKALTPNIPYRFSLNIESFAQLTNTLTIDFITEAQSTIVFKPDSSQNQFHRYDEINIPFTITYYNCIEQNPPSQILFYQIKLKNSNKLLMNGEITQGLVDGFKYAVLLKFDPYYFNFTNPYTLIFSTQLSRSDYKVQTSDNFDLFIIASTPILTIGGGNRMIGYDTNLYLNTTIKDQDYTLEEASSMNYTCYWECTDIVNGTNCQDQFGQTLIFDNQCQQFIRGKTFAPYQVFLFSVAINKNQVLYSTKITLQIIELDLPSLNVSGVDQSQIFNYYDEFIYSLIYPGVNPDLLMYSGAVLYDQVAQSTFQFYYLEVKFKLQNYFTALTQEIGTKVRLRLSIYDPRFIMPSINTQIQNMNIPPQFCQLQSKITNFVEFLDQISLTIIGCSDEDQPLLYSVQLYPNSSIYEYDLISSNFYHYLLIEPPQQQNSFTFTLPYLNREESLLVVLIQDSQGGITNLTKSIKIKRFENIDEGTFDDYQKKQINFNSKLLGIRIVTERLSQIENMQMYKQTLFEQMIYFDQNQSFFSNQTESLYHSISILAGLNCSILQVNETQLITQLNYRISLASQQLSNLNQLQLNNIMTSSQGIEKTLFIQQQYTFANILSSLIKFRVNYNQSSTDIMDQLNSIITKMQQISIANEPLYKIDTDSANLNFGYLTTKIAQSTTGISFQNKTDESTDTVNYNSSTSFFKYSQTRYLDNPYYSTQGFPKNSSGFQAVDPQMQIDDTTSDQKNLSQPIKFQFPNVKELAANTSLKCIAQVNSSEWSAGVCKTVKSQGQIVCQCNTLNPTSIMESLDFILDKAAQIYSLDTLLAFASFPFYETIVFYFYLTITGSYLTIIYWGTKVDNVMFSKIQDEVEKLSEEDGGPSKDNPPDTENDNQVDLQNNILLKRTIFKRQSTRVINVFNPKPEQIGVHEKSPGDHEGDHQNHPHILSQISSSPKIICDDFPLMKLQNPRLSQSQVKDTNFEQRLSKIKAYFEYLKFFHQILSVIYKFDEKQPRALRATIVYTSVMGSLAVLFVFNQPNNLSLTLALALVTAPLNKIYQIVLEKLLTNKKKLVRSIGGVLMVTVAGFMSYTMLAGLVLSGSVETANRWSYIFIGTFSLDNLIYSPIQLILQYCVHIGLIKFPTLQKILHKFLDEKGKEFLKQICVKTGLV